jgi:hypothetical protein
VRVEREAGRAWSILTAAMHGLACFSHVLTTAFSSLFVMLTLLSVCFFVGASVFSLSLLRLCT